VRKLHAGGVEVEQCRCESISSATAADGKTSRQCTGRQWGKATGWEVGRFRHVLISELFSTEKCNQVVMDFLAASDIGKFPPKRSKTRGQE